MNFEAFTSLLAHKHLTISAAESLTSGNFQTKLAATTNGGRVYPGGFITYSTTSKIKLLEIDPLIIKQFGVVSPQTAQAMARSTRTILGVDIGLGFTGAAGPKGLDGEDAGSLWIGLSSENITRSQKYNFNGTPERVIEQACQAGIELVMENINQV